MSPTAQADEVSQGAMIAKWAGSYNTDGFLDELAVCAELQKLLGAELDYLLHNLNVRGAVDLSSQTFRTKQTTNVSMAGPMRSNN